jgi:hypothetical protein
MWSSGKSVITINDGGCGSVDISKDGRAQPAPSSITENKQSIESCGQNQKSREMSMSSDLYSPGQG